MPFVNGRECFLFCAQTGVIRDTRPQAPSNFYWFSLPPRWRERVEAAVKAATVGSGGLEYPALFLRNIDAADLPPQGTLLW